MVWYASNGKKKVIARHQLEASHKAGVRALQQTSSLPAATTITTEVQENMAERVCNQKMCIGSFIAEHHLSLTISQPLVDLIKSVAKDQSTL